LPQLLQHGTERNRKNPCLPGPCCTPAEPDCSLFPEYPNPIQFSSPMGPRNSVFPIPFPDFPEPSSMPEPPTVFILWQPH
jgi:hypothetical protein